MPARRAWICDHLWIGRVVHTTKLLGAVLTVLAVLPAAAAASTNTLATYGTLTSGQAIVSPD